MNVMILKFAVSLSITLVVEIPIALLFCADRKDILLVLLLNILTNPAVVLISMLTGNGLMVQIILEIIVVLVEGCYYKKYSTSMKYVFLCSMCCNAASYGMGILIR